MTEVIPMLSDPDERVAVRLFLHAELKSAQQAKADAKGVHPTAIAQARIDALLDVYRPLLGSRD